MDLRKFRYFRVVGFLTLALFLSPAGAFLLPGIAQDTTESQVWYDPAGLEYVYIPPGSFQMGCVTIDEWCERNEFPRHNVTITQGFMMSRTEVTVRAYKRFCDATGHSMPSEPVFRGTNFNPGWRNLDHPIVNVTWHDAVAYCEWAGVRLPTEAEWEYAARGGRESWVYIWGISKLPIINGVKQANVGDEAYKREHRELFNTIYRDIYGYNIFEGYDDGYSSTAPVGSFPARFNLYDMGGNVKEWCSDWYDADYYKSSSSRDPQGAASGEYRVARSGSWYGATWDQRISTRSYSEPGTGSMGIGFRCVREVGIAAARDESRQETTELSEAERNFEKWLDVTPGELPQGLGTLKLGMDFVAGETWTLLGAREGITVYGYTFENGNSNEVQVDGAGKICGVEVRVVNSTNEYNETIKRYLKRKYNRYLENEMDSGTNFIFYYHQPGAVGGQSRSLEFSGWRNAYAITVYYGAMRSNR